MNKTQSYVNNVSLKNTSDLILEYRDCHSKGTPYLIFQNNNNDDNKEYGTGTRIL